MAARRKATDEQIAASYARLHNVWKVGEELGMCGQSVHQRLVKAGTINPLRVFSDIDKAILGALYHRHASTGTLEALAIQLGRTKSFVCRQARALGLTDAARPKPYLIDGLSTRARDWIAANGHPRGMLGKSHSAENKRAMSKRSTEMWASMSEDQRSAQTLRGMKTKATKGILAHPKPHGSWKAEWRVIGGQRSFFRSRWEANYARYLETLRLTGSITEWAHEPETFWFDKIKRGCRSYLPDFRVTSADGSVAYHEVKGWMDARSKTKIARMGRYHPKVALVVIDSKAYRHLAKQVAATIAGWEA